MSSLYKRRDSNYYWWTAWYKGRKVYKSTKMTQKHLARKVQNEWDYRLVLGETDFISGKVHPTTAVGPHFTNYLRFLETRKSRDTVETATGVLRRLKQYLDEINVTNIMDITVEVLDNYVDWLDNAPKTKKNHIGVIFLMLEQARKKDVIQSNPASDVTLPGIVQVRKYRLLEEIDLKIIFDGAGAWEPYYQFLYHTGLRAGDVARLKDSNIDKENRKIVGRIRKSRRVHEIPLSDALLRFLPSGTKAPLFPTLYSENDRTVKDNLAKPRKYMQALLEVANRPKATLHSFRVTFNNQLRDLGLSMGDRQALLAHSSSETTKIYTHPNFDLALKFVNQITDFTKRNQNVTK